MILDKTMHQVPKEATRWSLRLMAKHTDTTVWQVRQVWEAAGLKPQLTQAFKISNDPDFVESARGTSPRAAHRTVRDTLASYGSCH